MTALTTRAGRFARDRLHTLVLLTAVGAAAQSARADFTVGAEVPDFSLTSADGTAVTLQRDNAALMVHVGRERLTPKALVIHLLQPDCLQCRAQLEVLKPIAARYRERGVITLGIAHRGTPETAKELAESLGLPFPMAMGVGSEIAKQFAAGDTLGIADARGVIRFAQVGYGFGDAKLWEQALDEILSGKEVTKAGVDRDRLAVGDRLPAIHLPSLGTGKTMTLAGEGGRLVFRGEDGAESRPKAAIGFFSRYWAFSREEMVHLQKFHDKYADKGLRVFVISMHPNAEEARKLTGELKATYPIFNGHRSDLGKQYAYGWPAYILDAGGVIRHTQVGFEQGDEKKYESVIAELLTESPPWWREVDSCAWCEPCAWKWASQRWMSAHCAWRRETSPDSAGPRNT